MLDDATLRERVKQVSWDDTGIDASEMIKIVDLATWAANVQPSEVYDLREDPLVYKWDEKLFSNGKLEEARSRFQKGDRLAFHIPISIHAKSGVSHSYFEIFIEKDEQLSSGEERYIRNGITIPDISTLYGKPVRGLLVVKDDPLSSFLGDAENPSHTNWEERSSKIKEDYHHGISCLRFVKGGLKSLAILLTKTPEGMDEKLLSDMFYVDLPKNGEEGGTQPKPKTGDRSRKQKVKVPPTLRPVQLNYINGGFRISRRPGVAKSPKEVKVVVAYDVRGGNPFKRYDRRDFELDKHPVKIEAKGARIRRSKENELEFGITEDNFWVSVKGFDKRRDIRVRIETLA